ncbi:MAG: iron chelate uptake ABC transporter family permease subunit, partial [Chitinophagales bacterium]
MMGAVYIPVQEIVKSIFISGNSAADIIVMQSRLPKALAAVAVGMALPTAGLMMQTFFRNPVAGPD